MSINIPLSESVHRDVYRGVIAEYIIIKALGQIAYLMFYLFGWKFVNALGIVFGNIAYSLARTKRNEVKEELISLLGDQIGHDCIDVVVRRSFNNHYKRQIESIYFGLFNKNNMKSLVGKIAGLENIDLALAGGKGVILLLAHFGSFLLPLPFLGFQGYRINQLTGKPVHRSRLAKSIWLWRKKEANQLPVKFIQTGTFLRDVYTALRNNEIVTIACDGREGKTFQAVRLLNRTALLSTQPIKLALKAGAMIVPCFVIRQTDNTHKIIFHKPLSFPESGELHFNITLLMNEYAAIFGKSIMRYPCHYGVTMQVMKRASKLRMVEPLFA